MKFFFTLFVEGNVNKYYFFSLGNIFLIINKKLNSNQKSDSKFNYLN